MAFFINSKSTAEGSGEAPGWVWKRHSTPRPERERVFRVRKYCAWSIRKELRGDLETLEMKKISWFVLIIPQISLFVLEHSF